MLTYFCRAVVESNVPRTSNMEAPIMLLSGHSGEVFVPVFGDGPHSIPPCFSEDIHKVLGK